ncbi:hypothetical protein CROQUDRAFT_662697 [Cronartium quercuum f. sp. fusiforme G11]|uniref:Transcription activator of gluconeogenesis ERT1 n=1 Tax=Cronartium quercuum f. sp. fusiforme G11 TaxID=708437 RepID=A0A9P6T7V1_9BASI|nr:hypothetical protein CROQUDRAFT_662697 [Cronartium quercuum f. sp. fusiforme G11]
MFMATQTITCLTQPDQSQPLHPSIKTTQSPTSPHSSSTPDHLNFTNSSLRTSPVPTSNIQPFLSLDPTKDNRKRKQQKKEINQITKANHNGTTITTKRKKANRACFHCQKAHLTCDDGRPCKRCTKRGLGTTCTDGFRKKAKYLRDYDDQLLIRPHPNHNRNMDHHLNLLNQNLVDDEQVAGLEPSFTFSNMLEKSEMIRISSSPSLIPTCTNNLIEHQHNLDWPDLSEFVSFDHPLPLGEENSWGLVEILPNPWPSHHSGSSSSHSEEDQPIRLPPTPPPSVLTSNSTSSSPYHHKEDWISLDDPQPQPDWGKKNPLTKFNYEFRFWELERYLDRRFGNLEDDIELDEILKVLGILKPEIIFKQFSINEDDEELLERSLQRSLIALERMISVSGTPTVIWRRTGEMILVSDEFCMLTDFAKQELLNQIKFIYEVFDRKSTLEYFNKFNQTVFDNTNQQIMMKQVTLICPNGKKVNCSFCFTIKYDLFNCPSFLIGNFLPILSVSIP